jgi:hypothetical protein
VDLRVVVQFTFTLHAGVEALAPISIAVPISLQKVTSAIRQHDDVLAVSRNPHGFDESLFAEVAKVPIPRIARPIAVVPKFTRRHHAKRADGRERPALGAPKGILAASRVVDDLALASTREVDSTGEHFASTTVTAWVALLLWPVRVITVMMIRTVASIVAIIVTVAWVPVLLRAVRARSAAQRQCVVVIAVALVSIARIARHWNRVGRSP